jgi:hypothetical protein
MDEEIKELMDNYNLDKDMAERILDIINEHQLDAEEAIELEELL